MYIHRPLTIVPNSFLFALLTEPLWLYGTICLMSMGCYFIIFMSMEEKMTQYERLRDPDMLNSAEISALFATQPTIVQSRTFWPLLAFVVT